MQEYDLLKREFTYRPAGDMELTFDRWYSRFWDTKEFEVLVGDYVFEIQPKGIRKWTRKMPGNRMPRLLVCVCPKGYLDRFVSGELKQHNIDEYLEAYMPLARWEPE